MNRFRVGALNHSRACANLVGLGLPAYASVGGKEDVYHFDIPLK
jgi:hypothetical protein